MAAGLTVKLSVSMGAAKGLDTSSSIPFFAPRSTCLNEPKTVQPRWPSAIVSASSSIPICSRSGALIPNHLYTWPVQLSCGQWQASVVLSAASSQYCEQYFFPSVQTQLQTVCAHFLASAMGPSETFCFRQPHTPAELLQAAFRDQSDTGTSADARSEKSRSPPVQPPSPQTALPPAPASFSTRYSPDRTSPTTPSAQALAPQATTVATPAPHNDARDVALRPHTPHAPHTSPHAGCHPPAAESSQAPRRSPHAPS